MHPVRTPVFKSVLLVLIAALAAIFVPAPAARGQGCPAGWLPGQGVPGTNTIVFALTVLPGGDVIVGGDFTGAGEVAANRIARYNPSTNTWSALGSGVRYDFYCNVRALAVLPGGDVIAGGEFTTAGDVAANSIARYNPSTNTWSALGSGTNGQVNALAVLPSGDGPRKHCETADGTITNTRTHPKHEPSSLAQRSESPPIRGEGAYTHLR